MKNENLLSACVRLLLNLSEDVDVERKMCQKTELLKDLVSLLGRRNPELLKVTMVFLKKLSIVLENSIKVTVAGGGVPFCCRRQQRLSHVPLANQSASSTCMCGERLNKLTWFCVGV